MSDSQTLKLVPLNDVHIAAGGKMVPFAGFNMPVQYSGLMPEHHAVRNNVGMFDVSHMGEFRLKGPGVLDLLQHVTSNDVSKLTEEEVAKAAEQLRSEVKKTVDEFRIANAQKEIDEENTTRNRLTLLDNPQVPTSKKGGRTRRRRGTRAKRAIKRSYKRSNKRTQRTRRR